MHVREATACISAILIGVLAAPPLLAQRGDNSSDVPAQRRSNSVPGGSGSFNPTGPLPDRGPGSQPAMPPGGRGSFNPTGPDPGLPAGSYQVMPPGGRGSINPSGPLPDPGGAVVQGAPRGGVLSPRRQLSTGPTSKAPVPPRLRQLPRRLFAQTRPVAQGAQRAVRADMAPQGAAELRWPSPGV